MESNIISITALNKFNENVKEVQVIVKAEMLLATLAVKGISSDGQYAHFNVVAKPSQYTFQEVVNIEQKTRFELVENKDCFDMFNREYRIFIY